MELGHNIEIELLLESRYHFFNYNGRKPKASFYYLLVRLFIEYDVYLMGSDSTLILFLVDCLTTSRFCKQNPIV